MVATTERGAIDGFVGRVEELWLLATELEQVRSGTPRVVVVEGAVGIGKTSLVRRFLADARDLRVLWASGDETETRLPFGVVEQLRLRAACMVEGSGWEDATPAVGEDPLVVGAGLLQVLGATGVRGPLVVLVDDMQWADAASIQALTFALRRLQADPVLALLLVREDLSCLPEGLRRLACDRGVVLRVGGLSIEDLAPIAVRVTGERPPRRVLERLWDHTDGNPLHVAALLQELEPEELRRSDGPLPAPRSFAMVVVSRLVTCSPAARALVQAASVLGHRSPVGLPARVAGLDDPSLALDEATAAGVLRMVQTPAGPALAFCHPLVRAAIYHDLGMAWRSELHARAACLTAGSAQLDHRIAATLVEDADLAAEVAAHARREVAAGAVASAAAHLVTAARLSVAPADRERHLLDALEQLLLGGEVAEAVRLLTEVEALPDSTRRCYLLGQLQFLRGRRHEAEDLLVGAWQRCQSDGEDELGALVCLVLAQLCSIEMRVTEAVEWSQRVTASTGAAQLAAPALGVLVPCLGVAGRADESLALASLLPDATTPLSIQDVEGVLGRGLVRMWVDDLPGATADLSAVVTATRCRPASTSGLVALGFLAEAEYRAGAWDDSIVHGHHAVSLVQDSDQFWLAAFAHAGATWAVAARGDWTAAEDHVRAALAATQLLGDAASRTCAAAAAAHVAFTRADHLGVLDAIQPLVELERQNGLVEPNVHPWRHLQADALVSLGRLTEAEDALRSLQALAEARNRRSSLAQAARARGSLQAARGDAEGARHWFEVGLGHCEGLAIPFDRALIELM